MVLDIIFMLFAAVGFYTGYNKGIISTIFTVLSFTIGLLAAMKLAEPFSDFLKQVVGNDHPLMFIAGSILAFIIVMVVLRMLARGLEGILETANINFINQIIGGAVLAALSILVYSWLLWFGDKSHMVDPQTKQESITYKYTKEFPSHMQEVFVQLKPVIGEFWNASLDFIDRMEDMSVRKSEGEATIYDLEDEEIKNEEY